LVDRFFFSFLPGWIFLAVNSLISFQVYSALRNKPSFLFSFSKHLFQVRPLSSLSRVIHPLFFFFFFSQRRTFLFSPPISPIHNNLRSTLTLHTYGPFFFPRWFFFPSLTLMRGSCFSFPFPGGFCLAFYCHIPPPFKISQMSSFMTLLGGFRGDCCLPVGPSFFPPYAISV